MERLVEPEWLDGLPASDPDAARSREDLRRINRLMGHVGIMARLLRRADLGIGCCSLADLGAGDGSFALDLVRCLSPRIRISTVTLVDRVALLSAEAHAGFVRTDCAVEAVCADVFTWLQETRPATVMTANLFLHHFDNEQLARLLKLAAAQSEAFVACEPRRCWLSRTGSSLLGLLGCAAVTRHDAAVSVRAGFAGRELSRLWPEPSRWVLEESRAGLFSHSFLARRVAQR